jgi:autotransporter-associated beta strand protein
MKKSSITLLWVLSAVAVIGSSDCANAVQVVWQSVQTISAGTDVDTVGSSVLATYYAPTTGTESVNGVTFTSSGGLSTTQGGVTASLSQNSSNPYAGTNTAAANLGQPDAANYTTMLNNAVWTSANSPLTLTLTGLTPGQQYRVQFWAADYRGYGNRTSDLTPGSSGNYPDLTLYYGPTTSLGGSTVVGTFTADSATQSFSLVSSVGTQFNAFQLRQVNPTIVTWQPPQPITSSTEVGISGSTVLATYYAPGAETKSVNGVTFTSSGGLSTTQGGVTAALSQNVVNLYTPTNSASGGYGGADAANYTDLMNNAAWTNAYSPLTLTLTGLTPGQQYRVQFWSADYRGYGSRASDLYTGANGYPDLSVYYGLNAPCGGSRVVGTFTAGSSTQSFTWNSSISPQLNAFQLEVVTPTLVAQPASIVAGAASRLSWSLPTATSISISPGGPVTGTGVIVTPSNTTTYTLTASTPSGVVTQTATVTVSAPPGRNVLPTILRFGASPLAITSGSATTLKWLVYNATNLAVYPIGDVMGNSNPFYGDLYGSVAVRPTATTTYVLVASNTNGNATATATVTVGTQNVIYGNLQGADLGINASLNGALPFPADTSDPTSAGANSVLNKDISQAPVEPTSSLLLAQIAMESGINARVHLAQDFSYVVVSNSQPLVPINYTLIQGEPGPWPVPPDAPVQQESLLTYWGDQILHIGSADKHMSVINRDTGKIYEGYYAFPPADGSTDHSWTYGSATWPGSGQVIDSGTALNAQQIYTKLNAIYGGYGINTGGSYIFPTVLRYDEASMGVIRHALWMNLGTAARQGTSLNPCGSPTTAMGPPWPASNATMLPNGARIRLKSSVVIPSGVCTETRAVLQALKTYGAMPIDTSYQISAPGTNDYAWGIQCAYDMRFPDSMGAELAAAVNINTDFEVVEMDPGLTIGSITTAWPAGNNNPVFGVNGQSQVTFNGTVQSVNGHPLVGMNALGEVNVALNITSGAAVNSLTFNNAGFTIEGDPLTLTSSTITAVTGLSSIYSVIAGSVGLTKAGAGTLDACAANTYTGPTVINSGTLRLQRAAGAAPTAVTIASAANLQLLGNLPISSLSGSGSVTMGSGTLTLGSDNATTTYAGSISDWGSGLIKVGTGKLTLSGSNTYVGPTTVSGGWLALQTYNSSSAYSIASGATLEFNVATGTRDLPTATFSGTGTLVKSGTGLLQWGGGAATFALGAGSLIDIQGGTFTAGSNGNEVWTNNLSSLNIAAGATFNAVEAFVRVDALTGSGTCQGGYLGTEFITVGLNNGSGTFSGVLANFWAAFGLVKTGTGTQILTGQNTCTGTTTVSAGTLQLGDGTSGHDGSLAGASLVNNSGLVFKLFGSSTYGGVISGTGSLTKSGSGTLTLPKTSTYTGATSVSASRLVVSGTVANTASVTVSAGAEIDVTGKLYATGNIINSGTLVFSGTSPQFGAGGTITNNGVIINNSPSLTLPTIVNNGTILSVPPSPWQKLDIGTVGITGSATYLTGTYTVMGGGAGITSSSDAFCYTYQTSSSDCSVVARVASITNTNASAKGGVMIRSTTAANSMEAGVWVTPSSGIIFTYRKTTGATTSTSASTGKTAPYWVKITRTGNSFAGYYSTNGTSWTQLGTTQTISMGTSATIGLGVTSNVAGTLCTSKIDNVTATP